MVDDLHAKAQKQETGRVQPNKPEPSRVQPIISGESTPLVSDAAH